MFKNANHYYYEFSYHLHLENCLRNLNQAYSLICQFSPLGERTANGKDSEIRKYLGMELSFLVPGCLKANHQYCHYLSCPERQDSSQSTALLYFSQNLQKWRRVPALNALKLA